MAAERQTEEGCERGYETAHEIFLKFCRNRAWSYGSLIAVEISPIAMLQCAPTHVRVRKPCAMTTFFPMRHHTVVASLSTQGQMKVTGAVGPAHDGHFAMRTATRRGAERGRSSRGVPAGTICEI